MKNLAQAADRIASVQANCCPTNSTNVYRYIVALYKLDIMSERKGTTLRRGEIERAWQKVNNRPRSITTKNVLTMEKMLEDFQAS